MASNSDGQINPQSETGEHESQNQTPGSRDKLPPIVDSLQPPPSPSAHAPTGDKRYGWRENTKFALEVIGLCVLIAYTVFSCLQWLQIRWTNRLTREALDGNAQSLYQTLNKMQGEIDEIKRLADNAGIQAQKIGSLASYTKRSGDIALEALAAQDRPWVGLEKLEQVNEVAIGSSVKMRAWLVNYGHGPALKARLLFSERILCDHSRNAHLIAKQKAVFSQQCQGRYS